MASRKKWGKRKGDGEEEEAGASRPNKAPKTDAEEDKSITACELSKNRKVSVRKWKGQVLIDIREFWNKGDDCLPGKKGISLTMEQWNALQEHIDEIDSAIQCV